MAVKSKTIYVCQNCGAESSKWLGKCNNCGQWNTLQEEILRKEPTRLASSALGKASNPILLDEISIDEHVRILTGINELDRTLGGGLVPGSVVLIGGEPGVGKSTLALQLALSLKKNKTIYIAGEESAEQIKLRATRLNLKSDQCYILAETCIENIITSVEQFSPQLIICDSIQTVFSEAIESSPGSVSQIRECTSRLVHFAKTTQTPVVLIGHIVKDGSLAGPKVLEHIVDTVLLFEGERHFSYRILRATKNRFGSTSELGIFEMLGTGLKEVTNPSEILLSHNESRLSGIAVAATINGIRPYLVECQALVSSAVYGTPQRSANGIDLRRLNMLLAVLEKRAGFRLGSKDVFFNIAGGLKIDDPASDLAVAASVLSSNADLTINPKTCLTGEISLSGEIRPVQRIEQRIAEAEKLGFEQIVISKYNQKSIKNIKYKIEIVSLAKLEHLPKALFG